MLYMHCRSRVEDFAKWKSAMDSDAQAQHAAGLHLVHLWHSIDDPAWAFFVLEVHDVERARAFLAPESVAEAKKHAGVLEFEWHIAEKVSFQAA